MQKKHGNICQSEFFHYFRTIFRLLLAAIFSCELVLNLGISLKHIFSGRRALCGTFQITYSCYLVMGCNLGSVCALILMKRIHPRGNKINYEFCVICFEFLLMLLDSSCPEMYIWTLRSWLCVIWKLRYGENSYVSRHLENPRWWLAPRLET